MVTFKLTNRVDEWFLFIQNIKGYWLIHRATNKIAKLDMSCLTTDEYFAYVKRFSQLKVKANKSWREFHFHQLDKGLVEDFYVLLRDLEHHCAIKVCKEEVTSM